MVCGYGQQAKDPNESVKNRPTTHSHTYSCTSRPVLKSSSKLTCGTRRTSSAHLDCAVMLLALGQAPSACPQV